MVLESKMLGGIALAGRKTDRSLSPGNVSSENSSGNP